MNIEISALQFEAIIGILEHERQRPQNIRVDLSLEYEFEPGHYIDYVAIKECLQTSLVEKQYLLIEDAILDLKKMLTEKHPQISKIAIKIAKTELFPDCVISVSE